jgi:hypothetical protein
MFKMSFVFTLLGTENIFIPLQLLHIEVSHLFKNFNIKPSFESPGISSLYQISASNGCNNFTQVSVLLFNASGEMLSAAGAFQLLTVSRHFLFLLQLVPLYF